MSEKRNNNMVYLQSFTLSSALFAKNLQPQIIFEDICLLLSCMIEYKIIIFIKCDVSYTIFSRFYE